MSRSCMSCRTSVPNFSKFCTKCGVIYREVAPTAAQPPRQTQSSAGSSSNRPTRAWSASSKGSSPSSGSARNQQPTPPPQNSHVPPQPKTPPLPPGLQQPTKKESAGAGKWITAVVLCFVVPPVGLLMLGYLIFFDK